MKKSILLSLLIGMMVVIVFVGCQKDNRYVYKPNDELYEYCAFDSSSYWIYEDSATHQIDSVIASKKIEQVTKQTTISGVRSNKGQVLTFSQCYNIVNNGGNNNKEESIEPCVYFPKLYLSDYNLGLSESELYYIVPSSYLETKVNTLNWYYMNISTPSEIEYNYNDYVGYTFRYPVHYDNIIINNHSYQNVKRIDFIFKQTNGMVVCYWAKNIGLARWEYHDSDSTVRVKNLIKYNVVNVQNQYK